MKLSLLLKLLLLLLKLLLLLGLLLLGLLLLGLLLLLMLMPLMLLIVCCYLASFAGCRSASDVRAVLQGLASHAMSEQGENVMALEVTWTPSERQDSLTHRDIIVDYPELKQL